jgi:hypothetical protein
LGQTLARNPSKAINNSESGISKPKFVKSESIGFNHARTGVNEAQTCCLHG